jgi:hypothetical protein
LADKAHNAKSIVGDRRVIGEAIWNRFTGGRDGTRWYYRALAEFFATAMPGALADQLRLNAEATMD